MYNISLLPNHVNQHNYQYHNFLTKTNVYAHIFCKDTYIYDITVHGKTMFLINVHYLIICKYYTRYINGIIFAFQIFNNSIDKLLLLLYHIY